MKLLVIRHAVAEDRESFARTGEPDALRPLTIEGRRKMRAAARGLRRVAGRIDLLAASPLARAVQTAEIVRAAWGDVRTVVQPALLPGRAPAALLAWLRARRPSATIAVVGHEPDLGRLVGYLTAGLPRPVVELRKGQACLLEFSRKPRAGGARIVWSLKSSQLRRMA
ncbi:MAG: histidine phosphatase family protein [Myxococcota bacterium]